MSIAAGAVAVVAAISAAGHPQTSADKPPRTPEQRQAHHQHVVHHKHVVKQRIRERQHQPTPTPTPGGGDGTGTGSGGTGPGGDGGSTPPTVEPTPAPTAPAPAPVKHTRATPKPIAVTHHAVTVVRSAPARQVVVAVARVAPKPATVRDAASRRQDAAPVTNVERPPAVQHRAATAPSAGVEALPGNVVPAIVEAPRHVVEYAQREFASMQPAVKIGFGALCALGLFMMGYAVAVGRRPKA